MTSGEQSSSEYRDDPITDEASCRVFIEAAGAGVCKVNVQGRIADVDRRFCEMLEQSRASLIGRRFLDLVHPGDRRAPLGVNDAFSPERVPLQTEIRYLRSGRPPVWVIVFASWSGAPDDPSRHWVSASVDITKRKSAEQAVRDSEARLSAIFDYSPVGLCELSLQGEFLKVNDAICEMLGRSREELLTMNAAEVTHPDDRRHSQEAMDRLVKTGVPNSVDKRHVRPDGTVVFTHSAISQPGTGDGKADVIIAVTVDMTERQRIQAEMAADLEANKRLQSMSTELIPSGDVGSLFEKLIAAATEILGADCGVIHLLNGGENDLQLLAQSQVGSKLRSVCERENRQLGTATAQALNRSRRVIVHDYRNTAQLTDNQLARAYIAAGVRATQATPLISRSGVPLGVISTHYCAPTELHERHLRMLDILARQTADLVERIQSETALRDSEEHYRTLFESIDEGFCIMEIIFDDEGKHAVDMKFLQVNPAFECRTGLNRAAGKLQSDIMPGLERSWLDTYEHIVLSGEPQRFVNELKELDLWFEVYAFPIGPRENRQVAAVFNDVTGHMREQTELKQADRRKNEFLAVLAHELRNPLAPIRSGLQILRLSSKDNQNNRRLLELMERQMRHLVRLVDDLLNLSRITQGKIHIHREITNLQEIMESAIEGSRDQFASGGVRLEVNLPPRHIALNADAARLAQVFSNLLNNAAKYTHDGGHVKLIALVEGDTLTVTIRDTGEGIPAHMLDTIFDPFTQVERRLTRHQEGLGVGLSLVQTIVQLHGGRVTARSEGAGKGSEFTVQLPRTVVHSDSPRSSSAPQDERALGGHRVLVIDDNVDAADALTMTLEITGNQVKAAYGGEQGLSLVDEFKPELMLLDLGMPELDGYEVARRVREKPRGKSVVIAALTGWGQDEDRRRSREAGFDYHLVKPVDINSLREILTSLPARSH